MSDSRIILQCLSYIASRDALSRSNGLLCLNAEALAHPRLLLTRLDEIDCVLVTLCASDSPRWGTVNGLMDALAIALLNNTENHDSTVAVHLIEMSRLITEVFFKTSSEGHPDLFSFVSGLIHAFNSEYFLVDLSVVLAITDHCSAGFLPDCSLVSILMERFVFVIPLIANSFSLVGRDRFARPLSSTNAEDLVFFLTMWVALLELVADDAFAIGALAKCLQSLMELHRAKCLHAPAHLLLRFVGASPQERRAIAAEGARVVKRTLQETRQREPARRAAPEPKRQPPVRRAKVELLKKRKWIPHTIVYIEAAQVVAWSLLETATREGVTLEFGDIAALALAEPGRPEADRENVLKVVSKKGEFLTAFQTHADALEWTALLRQSCGIV
jgi:hypothetical protein